MGLARNNATESTRIKKNIFLAKDNEGFTAGQHAARNGKLEALETLLCFAYEVELSSDEL